MPRDDQARVGKLVLSAENRVLREVLIDRKRLTIGRRPHNDLLLDDLTVSGEHAMVHTVDGESMIQDLMSRNGTLINGAPVVQQQLAHGDCIDIGIYRLVYKVERVAAKRTTYGFWAAFMPTSLPPLPTNLAGERTSAWVPSRPVRYPGPSRPAQQGHVIPGPAADPAIRGILPKPEVPASPAASANSAVPGTPALPGTPAPPGVRALPGTPALPSNPSDPTSPAGPHDRARSANPPPPKGVFIPAVPRSGQPVRPLLSSGPFRTSRAASPAAGDPSSASLHFLGGHEAGRRMLVDRPIVSIRNGLGQVAVVARRTTGYFVTHLEGPAYPLVNGESIGLGAHRLRDNDLIELAGTIIQFSLGR